MRDDHEEMIAHPRRCFWLTGYRDGSPLGKHEEGRHDIHCAMTFAYIRQSFDFFIYP